MEEMKEVLNRLDSTIAALTTQMVGMKDEVKKIGNRVRTLETVFEQRNPIADIPVANLGGGERGKRPGRQI